MSSGIVAASNGPFHTSSILDILPLNWISWRVAIFLRWKILKCEDNSDKGIYASIIFSGLVYNFSTVI